MVFRNVTVVIGFLRYRETHALVRVKTVLQLSNLFTSQSMQQLSRNPIT